MSFQPNLPRIFFSKIGNQQLRTAIWTGTDKGFGKRTPLLFFNGIGANLEIAQLFADTFTGRDIITFDMPGVGGSPDPKLPYRPWWVAKAAKRILRDNGYHRVDVLGVSWGGGPAQQFAWQNKSMTRRLILCATSPGWTMVPGNPKALSKMMSPKRYIDRDFLAKNFETLYGDASDKAGDFAVNMVPPSIKGYLYQLGAMAGWSSLLFARRIRARTLIIMGGNDHIVPPINGRILHAVYRRSRLEILPDAGHLFLLTRRDETVALIRDFFGEPDMPVPHAEPAEVPSVAASFIHANDRHSAVA
ncbi:alpha/beta fold hydrolase [uncultured Algimonas sp.]|uniref:alpha/beta fold hydrolase n=1 Tax=uncultured Algimonas sp. TaxID=1547920 RepID=UPI00262C10B4|nr:alpha/beta fold hydrolase [uncultured Algimonas sp.]